MDVFAIKKNGKPSLLNIDNFEELTKKRFPYYQYGTDKKLKCYAVCPECGHTEMYLEDLTNLKD